MFADLVDSSGKAHNFSGEDAEGGKMVWQQQENHVVKVKRDTQKSTSTGQDRMTFGGEGLAPEVLISSTL